MLRSTGARSRMNTAWAKLLRWTWPGWPKLMALAGLTCGTVAFEALNPWPLKLIIDHVLQGHQLSPGWTWLTRHLARGDSATLLWFLTLTTVGLFVGGWLCRA